MDFCRPFLHSVVFRDIRKLGAFFVFSKLGV